MIWLKPHGILYARGVIVAHYSFNKDLELSKQAVEAVKYDYIQDGCLVRDIDTKEEQVNGDLAWRFKNESELNEEYIEVKYDIMSTKTGNLCFEIFNGSGRPTGILRTPAETIAYVLDSNNGYTIMYFNADELRAWIFNPKNYKKVRMVAGGDGGRYKMLLVKKEDLTDISMLGSVTHAELSV